MRISPKLVIAGLFAVAILIFTLIFTSETKVVAEPVVATEPSDHTVSEYIEKVEMQNELERDAKQEAYMHEKMAKAKKESVECKFWQQQLTAKATPKNKEKVAQFCELQDEASSESASSTPQAQPAQKATP